MEKQEKNQLKDLLKKYLDGTPMGDNQLKSVEKVLSMLDDSNTNGGYIKEKSNTSPEDYLKVAGLHDKISGNNISKQSATELNKELEEANEFLKYVTNMCEKAFNIDEAELEDSSNEKSYDDPVSVFDLDIKEVDDISDNLYDWGLEDADVSIDKDGNVLVYELFSDDIPHFTEAFNDAFSKDMSKQDITDYLKDAYNRYKSNKPLKDSYEEGYPIEDDLRNGRVFLKEMVVKFPHMDAVEEKYNLFPDAVDVKGEPVICHYYVDGVKYIISKSPEKKSFDMVDKRLPLYDTEGVSHPAPFDEYKQLPFSVSLDKMLVTRGDSEFELNKLKSNNENLLQYYLFTTGDKAFVIYNFDDSNAFYLKNTLDL